MSDRSESSGVTAEENTNRIEQIADAALRLFARYGYKRTSMDDIAKEAGLAKATLYLHFKGKDDVFRAMFTLIGRRVEARCREVMALEGPFATRLAKLLLAHYVTAYASFGTGEHLAELKAVMASIAVQEMLAFDQAFIGFARQLLATAEGAGEISFDRAGLDAGGWIASLMFAAAGAKMSAPQSCEGYSERLEAIAKVFAAAVGR